MATGIVSTFVPLYMIDALHAPNPLIALLNSIPALTGLAASLLGAFWVPRLWSLRRFSALNFLFARLTYILLAAVPLFGGSATSLLVVWVNAASNVPQTLGLLGWQGLMGKLIPSAMRENFFSRRNSLAMIVGLGGTIITGAVLQFFNPQHLLPFQTFFVLAAGLGGLEVWYLLRHREPVSGDSPPALKWQAWARLWKDARFRRYVVLSALFNFTWQMSWPLFSIYQIETAHATGLWIGLFTIATQATEIVTFRWWGTLARRHGGLATMGLSGLGMSIVPILTVMNPNLVYLVGVNLYSGLFASGMTLLLFTELLHAAPIRERSGAIVFYNVVLGGVAFLAPEVGVYLLPVLGMKSTMLLSTVGRVVTSTLFLLPLKNLRQRF